MIPGLALAEKVIVFAIDIFVSEKAKADAAKSNVKAWFSKSGKDAKRSAEMRLEYQRMREDESLWPKDKS